MLEFVREAGLADEQERQRHLDTKAGTLAGLIAVALALEAGLGATVLIENEIACVARTLFIACFVLATGGLAASAVLAIIGVLIPQPYPALGDRILAEFATRVQMETGEETILERQLATVVDVTLQTRRQNGRKAKRLRWASFALAGAIAAILGQSLTLLFA